MLNKIKIMSRSKI